MRLRMTNQKDELNQGKRCFSVGVRLVASQMVLGLFFVCLASADISATNRPFPGMAY